MSARHRQHKRKIIAAKQALAEREVDLVSYLRVIADMSRQGLPLQTRMPLVPCRDEVQRDCQRLRAVINDLEKAEPT